MLLQMQHALWQSAQKSRHAGTWTVEDGQLGTVKMTLPEFSAPSPLQLEAYLAVPYSIRMKASSKHLAFLGADQKGNHHGFKTNNIMHSISVCGGG